MHIRMFQLLNFFYHVNQIRRGITRCVIMNNKLIAYFRWKNRNSLTKETPECLRKMSTNDHATEGHVCCSGSFASPSVHQTLDELDFDRGIWNAAVGGDISKVKHHLDQGTNSNAADNYGYTALVNHNTVQWFVDYLNIIGLLIKVISVDLSV